MRFKKIEIHGFKSFPEKLQVQFEAGVTGIVGPNGCGKSNVADSIRWVLGEQSAKSLRGSSMQDVIFNGTEKRPSQSFAEVSLFFDNSEKIFPVDFEEVVISRKLYRSGESEYAINRNPCRLKDIIDTFRDSGIGKEGYAVIGQGKIDELLSAKPEERRAVFEEAAGIAKFKSRKLESERKLERTRTNLTRISDILSELEKQVTPLKAQAETAKTYLDLKEKLKILEVNTYVYQYDNASTIKAQIAEKLKAIEEDLNSKNQSFEKAQKDFSDALSNIQNLDEQIEKLRDELLSLTVGLEKTSGESRLFLQKKDSQIANLSKCEEKIEDLENELSKIVQSTESTNDKIKFRKMSLESLKKQHEELTADYLSIVDKINASEASSSLSGNQMISALGELSDAKSELASIENEKKNLIEKQVDLKQKFSELETKIFAAEKEISKLDETVLKFSNELEKHKLERDKNTTKHNETTLKLSKISKEIEEENAKYHSLLSRTKVLKEMHEHNEGLTVTVQKLLREAKENFEVKNLIVDVVANIFKVDKKFEIAIETALGQAVNNIITKTPEDAEKLINFLKQKMFGRATFLPISSVREKELSFEQKKYLNQTKCFGLASDLVQFDLQFENVVKSLLGSTAIVEDMKAAISIAESSRYSFKIVTLDGDVIFPFGSMSGGSRRTDNVKVIGREREITENELLIEKTNTNINDLIKQKEELLKIQSQAFSIVQKESDEIHRVELEKVQETEKHTTIKTEFDENKKEIADIDEQLKFIENRQKHIVSLSVSLQKQIAQIESKKQFADESKQKIGAEFDLLKNKRERLLNEVSDSKVKIAESEVEISGLLNDVKKLEKQLSETEQETKEAKEEKQNIIKEIASLDSQIKAAVAKSSQIDSESRLKQVRDKLANFDTFKGELQSKMHDADIEKMRLSGEIQRIAERKAKEELQVSKLDFDIEAMQERIWEEYGLTYASAVPFKQDDFVLTKGLSEASKIKKQIAALGPINVNAIEDVKDVETRFNDLSGQNDDLKKAEKDLLKIIGELSNQMQERFKSQFEQINENFKQIFKELFGGGKAELKLQDQENLLETGIDIVAEPPGKKLQNISLLSGGERAMTAIAILFAILKLKPMPFCVLDEIEAALDDANAERFAKYLKKFSQNTQFIVITHRKPTMELADCLYGVTMEEKGVSKMVSVQFKEAVRNSVEAK